MRAANLVYKGVPPKQVLAVTFTNKAANEMRERVLSLFEGDKKKSPVISTFHSFCLNTVLRHEIMHLGYQRNFTVFDSGEQMSLIRNLMGDIESEKSFKADLLMENISKVKNGMFRLNDPKRDGKELSEVMNSLYDKYH
ncbi:MAG: ATP-dependent helicase Rep, partial [Deltaproteobacteria bacterium]|nr:ATP-dependent helicase Rep [Deltaproteobacteria bacterium]